MRAVRKRTETGFSQCTDLFRMDQNFKKTFSDLLCLTASKLAGIFFSQLIKIDNSRKPSLVEAVYIYKRTTGNLNTQY